MKLKQYNPDAVCPKCGCKTIKTRWEDKIENDLNWYERKYYPRDKWPETEYMHRTCERCDFQWPEKSP